MGRDVGPVPLGPRRRANFLKGVLEDVADVEELGDGDRAALVVVHDREEEVDLVALDARDALDPVRVGDEAPEALLGDLLDEQITTYSPYPLDTKLKGSTLAFLASTFVSPFDSEARDGDGLCRLDDG